MKFETIHNLTLPKIGFGTWKIGGNSSVNRAGFKVADLKIFSAYLKSMLPNIMK
ncbi:MAG: hypothetical protein ABI986_10755 [Chloroflexota bacterium]